MPKLSGYQITETLFSSPFTRVFRGKRESDQFPVIIRGCGESDATQSHYARLAFTREVLALFDNKHIAKPVDWIDDQQQPWLLMEDILGEDLWHFAKRFKHEQLTVETFLELAIQLADALSIIHHQQVIHKDLHPGNIVVNPDTLQVQVIDFGLSSLLSREQPVMAAPESLEGILAYLSPEQTGRMNRALDYRTDFYTLGITLYQLLAGQLPYEAEDAMTWVHAHIAAQAFALDKYRSDVPVVLELIIKKLMSKNAEDRYQSALGLKHDLTVCLKQWKTKDDIADFKLGQQDISDRFQIPQKLYGREQEVQILLDSFTQVREQHQAHLLAVAGYSGIGKSALVHEIHKPISAHGGVFIEGKFDQFQHNMPYSALREAFKTWIQRILLESNLLLNQRKQDLLDGLGNNAQVLIDFLPEFSTLLGGLPKLTELGAQETQNRFHTVFKKFIKIITSSHPLILFIDDLQWSDQGTLDLLPVLINEMGSRLLVLTAYRDNEVNDTHPAMMALETIKQNSPDSTLAVMQTLTLEPLTLSSLNELIGDALHNHQQVRPLSELVLQKTAGNPFFVSEFLKTLYQHCLFNFDLTQQRWCWDLDTIKAQDITDNVVELMLEKMHRLPSETQALIQLAACIGTRFDLQTLAIISEQPMPEIARSLWPAIQQGLLLQDGGDWHVGMLAPHSSREIEPALAPNCRFLHDRMLQAAYQSLDEAQRQHTHLTIGRLLKKHQQSNNTTFQGTAIFEIVEQLNEGRNLITDKDERLELAKLNLQVAQLSKAASVWDNALRCTKIAMDLLPNKAWEELYDLTLTLNLLRIECEYLTVNQDTAERLAEEVLQKAQSTMVKAQLCDLLVLNNLSHGNLSYGTQKAIEGVGYCGIDVPSFDEALLHKVEIEQAQLNKQLQKVSITDLEQRPLATDPHIVISQQLLSRLAQIAAITKKHALYKFSTLTGMNIILRHGISEQATYLLALYGVFLIQKKDYQTAFEFAQLAIKIINKNPNITNISPIYVALGLHIWFYKRSLDETIALHQRGFRLGSEYGDPIALGCFGMMVINLFAKGEPLPKIASHIQQLKKLMLQYKAIRVAGSHYQPLIDMLQDPKASNLLRQDAYSASEWAIIQATPLKAIIPHLRLQWYFWNNDTEQAQATIPEAEQTRPLMLNSMAAVEHDFLKGLLLAKQFHQGPPATQKTYLTDIQQIIVQFEGLTAHCTANFEHKYLLLSAEYSKLSNPNFDTLKLYHQTIQSAKKNGFLQYQALANELLGRFLMNYPLGDSSNKHLKQAYQLYGLWGCAVKQQAFEKEFPELFAAKPVFTNELHSLSVTETSLQHTKSLDLESIITASQSISNEIQLSKLLENMMRVIVTNAGAQSGVLVLANQGEMTVEAHLKFDPAETVFIESAPLQSYTRLPVAIVQYVTRTNEAVILQNLPEEEQWNQEPYFKQHQPLSILCMPINYRDKLMGVLYLENTLSTNAFTEEHISTLKMLSTQAAISLENARLFNKVTALNMGLEEQVAIRTNQLAQSNTDLNQAVKDLELANKEMESFSYRVSHDLRAPLRTIKGFSKVLLEDYLPDLHVDAQDMLNRVVGASGKMDGLISGLFELSKIQKQPLVRSDVTLSDMAQDIIKDLREHYPEQQVKVEIEPDMHTEADPRMLYSVIENLLNNAWKYSSKKAESEISFGTTNYQEARVNVDMTKPDNVDCLAQTVYFIKDNGAGFDMQNTSDLFTTFKRLHTEEEFSGTGIGLATVKRIIDRHGGQIWAEAEIGKGARFYFTLGHKNK